MMHVDSANLSALTIQNAHEGNFLRNVVFGQ